MKSFKQFESLARSLRRANSASGVGNVHSEVAAALAGAFVVRGAV